MNKTVYAAMLLLMVASAAFAKDDPVANPKAVVTCGNARFTVLTDRLIRMEWSEDGVFEDRATLGIVNRNLPVPKFKVSGKTDQWVSINTGSLMLTYRNKGSFNDQTLYAYFKMAVPGQKKQETITWKPSLEGKGNLLGTTRTLDRCSNKDDILAKGMDKGVISREGWAVIDESNRHVFVRNSSDWGEWVEARPEGERYDLYLFVYGHDYMSAVSDYAKIAGKVPLPPKYAFGFWQSRYWSYSDYEFIDMAKRFRREDIPADVMIIDMDWHKTFALWDGKNVRTEFEQRQGWTGYTWNPDLFPEPDVTLEQLHELGFKTSLNLHPADGIQPYEDCYDAFVEDYLSNAKEYDGPENYVYNDGGYAYKGFAAVDAKAGQKAPVAFRISDMTFADSYFRTVLHPLEQQGVDFWWLDWQQWPTDKYVKDLSMTFWLNHTFFNDKVRQSAKDGIHAARPMIYHRWGGIGSHRYQLGFSGDTIVEWSALEMLPWFTATSSNVCYGYWGHDLGGHMKGDGMNGELFLRWLQYGVFSPIFKVHSSKDTKIERRFWNYPEFAEYLKDAVRLRYDLSRYIYDAARQCYDTGISLCRPLYYYSPEDERAYTYEQEFMFGNNILATAICQPADPVTRLSERKMFFPEGSDWYDMATGRTYKGGSEVTLKYALNENPWYVKAGAIIPMASHTISNLQEADNVLRILVAPGEGSSEYVTYEDDGCTQAFEKEFATTRITKVSDSRNLKLVVEARKGSYADIDPLRNVMVVLEGVLAPKSIKVNGREIGYSRFPEREIDAVWGFDGKSLSTIVYFGEESANRELVLECEYGDADRNLVEGKKGLLGRMMAVTDEVKRNWNNPAVEYLRIANCASLMNSNPFEAAKVLSEIDVDAMKASWSRRKGLPADFITKMNALVEE